MRLIDADALIENFGKLTVILWLDSVEEAEIVSLIGNAPTIEPKCAEWIDKGDWMGIECSRCKCHSQYITPFCSQCGARMKGADDE